ncbi:hypothetical protein [Leisingera daeponensis]|uniref:hypothetical protein n=1 Tax=Leisingera daeponensis TaxID=405746 RepID=UPI001C988030|nr:hypothetical protein [Leisingera daeponensis]MBY6056790.1 hypothetical protein [Leisingera daeponensis]
MQDLSKEVIAAARLIASRPEDHIDNPAQFTTAWAALKAARGQGFDPARLRAAHLIDRPGPTPEPTSLDARLLRIARKAREIAEAKGYSLPPAA